MGFASLNPSYGPATGPFNALRGWVEFMRWKLSAYAAVSAYFDSICIGEAELRVLQFIAVVGLALACALAPARAEKRVALVVGNGAYLHADKLANPVNDARGVRDALKQIGFDVIYGENLDQKALRRTVGDFARAVSGAAVAVVYFAGHGATFGDTPYVVPIDAEFSSLEQAPYDLVPVETLIGELRRVDGVRIAILDACRDNAAERELKKQATRGGEISRGLAPMKNPDGLILAYATQYLSTAADGSGANSPFTAALLHNIATPGLDVKDLFFKVGQEVVAATGRKQRPEISISMYEPYALVPAASSDALPGAAATPVKPAGGPQTAAVAPPVKPAVPSYNPCSGLLTVFLVARCVAPLTATQERELKPKDRFRECEDCPEMVVVPAGRFTMGSPSEEKERDGDEGPQHAVTIRQPFAVGKFHVTRDQFAVFARETGYTAHSGCDWRNPGFTQEGSHPVVCVSWDDANAYANWLAKKTGKPYRLLSEAEWEYVARAGTATPFWWGSSITPAQANYDGNYVYAGGGSKGEYRAGTVPAGSFDANPWGLYDVHGNAWQWTADCWHVDYNGAPTDGSAWTTTCSGSGRFVRGGSWDSYPRNLRAAVRYRISGEYDRVVGIRLARTLTQ
jgi:formylglycine-generating enzyme required for sulfatase activity